MVYKRFYLNLVIRIVLMSATCLALFFVWFRFPNYSLIAILVGAFLLQILLLINYISRINHKLEQFFMIYLSGDLATSSSRKDKKDEFSPMYQYFDEINAKLEKTRIENEIQNNYFRTIVDQTAVGLISFHPDGTVEFFNDTVKKIFGINVLRNLYKLNRYKEGLAETLLELKSNDQTLVSIIQNGELFQLATKKVMFKAGDKLLHLVSFQNIKPELDEKELESWQKLIRVLTHEIMNSMTPIITLVTTISRQYKNKEDGSLKKPGDVTGQVIDKTIKGLELIETRGQGLIHFVQNYREVTRLPKPEFRLINVRDMFSGILLLFEEQFAKSGIICTLDCHPSLYINGDIKLLEQVFINLVKNAAEALDETPEPAISITAQTQNNQTVIEVIDNGKGIPQDLLENIFVPFFTTKQQGSGIGLSLSRQIIRLHGGTMNVQSEPGTRTLFTIKL